MHIPAVCGPAPRRAQDMILRHNGAVRAAVSAAVSAFTTTSGCNSFCAPRGLRSNSSPAKGVHAALPHVAVLRSRGLRAAGLARQIRKTRCVQICAYRTASAILVAGGFCFICLAPLYMRFAPLRRFAPDGGNGKSRRIAIPETTGSDIACKSAVAPCCFRQSSIARFSAVLANGSNSS